MTAEEHLHSVLQFQPLQSSVDVAFWSELASLKLDTLQLSEKPLPVLGSFTAGQHAEVPSPLQLDMHSFSTIPPPYLGRVQVPGELHNLNTLDKFKGLTLSADQNTRSVFIANAVAQIWRDIASGAAEHDPAVLWRFIAVSFADLKKYHFYYWFCFPALQPPQPITAPTPVALNSEAGLGPGLADQVIDACKRQLQHDPVDPSVSQHASTSNNSCCLVAVGPSGKVDTYPIHAWPEVSTTEASPDAQLFIACVDPGNSPSAASWPLRNLLLLAAVRWKLRQASVICLRSFKGTFHAGRSLYLEAHLPEIPAGWQPQPDLAAIDSESWERNARGKVGPRLVPLGSAMDPRRLAESAVDLNLKLMRWRAAPGLQTQKLSEARCLLLGAGTLGCAVARILLGWGVRHITLVDNSNVAFSNPVRQSLFSFEDCLEGGKPKALAAAAALKAIFPSVNAVGLQLSVPMPGHAVAESEQSQVEEAAQKLHRLIQEHDAVFLLMDTREARWLPSLLAAAEGRLAINAALGFDSYLVMRHGGPPLPSGTETGAAGHPTPAPGSLRLGCYFCNDIIAPLDSTLDRTLDQQCTVARPGLASIAGALAVELMAAVVQHPLGVHAPAAIPVGSPAASHQHSTDPREETLPLGPAPHRLQGRLSNGFVQHCLTGQASPQCTACSPKIVEAFRAQGLPFLMDVLQDPQKLLDLSGLTELLGKLGDDSALEAGSEEDAWGGEGQGAGSDDGGTSSLMASNDPCSAAETPASPTNDTPPAQLAPPGCAPQESHLVFVYGSLLPGLHNAALLHGCEPLGYGTTAPEFSMFALAAGSYPAVCRGGSTAIRGAVFAVNNAVLAQLDRLEGHPEWYRREQVPLASGPAELVWIYVMPIREVDSPFVRVLSGDWAQYYRAAPQRSHRWRA